MNQKTIEAKADARRADALAMVSHAGTGHIGGTLSSMDILCTLYYDTLRIDPAHPDDPDRDRFLLSKGHSVEGYWAVLADLGYFPKAELRTFSQPGSRLIGHPNCRVPGVEMCTGALGHGLPIGVGMAIGAKRQQRVFRTFVLMGDGEQAEGSVWEAAMAGAHHGLDNLIAIIDRNGLQISGTTEQVMHLEDFPAKWRAFGWDVTEIDGHDVGALQAYFSTRKQEGKPHCLIAHTRKGKGLPCAEGDYRWHHKVPTAEQVQEGYAALGVKGVDWA